MKNETLKTLSIRSVAGDGDDLFGHFSIGTAAESLLQAGDSPKMVEAGAIFICTQGEAEIVLDQKKYSLKGGDLCLVFPYTIFQVTSRSGGLHGHIYAINADILKKFTRPPFLPDYVYIRDNPCIALTSVQQEGLLMLCELIKHKVTHREDPFGIEMAERLLTVFSYEIATIYSKSQPKIQNWQSRHDRIFRQFLFSLARNYRVHRDVEYYAQEAFVTPRHFSHIIKQKSGRTAAQWIVDKVISQAKNLLSGTQLTVQQISEELHFANPSFFGQYFKKYAGMTPKAYRDRCIGDIPRQA